MSAATEAYSLTVPCRRCPFRRDVEPYLRPERAAEIARGLREGSGFPCHKTTVPGDSDEEELREGPDSKQCPGALATMENEGTANQMMRIAERLGLYRADRLDRARPLVYGSLSAWVRSYYTTPTVTDPLTGDEIEYDHCGVVGEDCEDPAGYLAGGGAVDNDDEPTCNPLTDECQACGHLACPACRSWQWDDDGRYCVTCHDEYEDD